MRPPAVARNSSASRDLPTPWLPGQRDRHAHAFVLCSTPRVAEPRELPVAADKAPAVATGRGLSNRQQTVCRHEIRLALQHERLHRLHRRNITRQLDRGRANQDAAGAACLFQSRCDIHGIAGRQPLGCPGDHLSGHHTGQALETQRRDGVAHLDGGTKRPQGVISWTVGTPNTAMTASPMNFSTVPPWRSTMARISSKYRPSSSRSASGSSRSPSAVETPQITSTDDRLPLLQRRVGRVEV